MEWKDYVYENGVLKNKFNIMDENELYRKETEITIEKLTALILQNIFSEYNVETLKKIHKYLFSDIYEFAGEFREVEIYKRKSSTIFTPVDKIESELEKVITEMNKYDLSSKSKYEIAMFYGDYYYKLIMIHPFREGNGRTIREFLRQFVSFKTPQFKLNYSKINKRNFLEGIVGHDNYPSLLAWEIYNALEDLPIKKI